MSFKGFLSLDDVAFGPEVSIAFKIAFCSVMFSFRMITDQSEL